MQKICRETEDLQFTMTDLLRGRNQKKDTYSART